MQNDFMTKKIYFTATGLVQRLPDTEFLKPGMKVELEKEPDNEWDREAIKIKMPGLGQIGYVANSVRTVVGESFSAGRLYDKIGDTARGAVLYNMGSALVCELDPASLVFPER